MREILLKNSQKVSFCEDISSSQMNFMADTSQEPSNVFDGFDLPDNKFAERFGDGPIEPCTMRMSKIDLGSLADIMEETQTFKNLFGARIEQSRPGEDKIYVEDFARFEIGPGLEICLKAR